MKSLFINAGIRITRNCNLKCPYCNIQAVKKEDLTLEQWKKAGAILKSIGIKDLVILGGEPTEYRELPEFVDFYENTLGIKCSMTTNAYNNFDQVVRVIDSGLSRIGVSVDSINVKASISPFKNKMGLKMIDELVDLNKNIQIVDYAVLNKKNIDNIDQLIEYMTNKDVSVYFLPFHHSHEGEYEHRKNNQNFAFVTEEDIEKYCLAIDKIIEMKKDGFLIANSIEFLDMSKKFIKDLNWKCNGLSELRIDSDGKMVCCCDVIGNVNRKYSIFDLDISGNLDNFIKDRDTDSSTCSGCLWPSSVEAELRKNECCVK